MKRIWAPWRMKYITEASREKGCIFCKKIKGKKGDKEGLVIARGKRSFVVLNLYPYTNGHLMVAPFRHIASLEKLRKGEIAEMMELTQKAIKALKRCYNPDGFNVGFNLGTAAGAGVKDHIHLHIVPRWAADTNFMPVLCNTKIIPESLEESCLKLRKYWG